MKRKKKKEIIYPSMLNSWMYTKEITRDRQIDREIGK